MQPRHRPSYMQLEATAETRPDQTLNFLAERFCTSGTFMPEFKNNTSTSRRLGEYAGILYSIFPKERLATERKRTIEQSLYLACSIAESLESRSISPLPEIQSQAESSTIGRFNPLERQYQILKISAEYLHINPVLGSLIDRNLSYIYTPEDSETITPIQHAISAFTLRQIEINNFEPHGYIR